MSWNPERLAILRRLWNDEHLTATQISHQLGGVSRNAVLAMARRQNLDARPAAAPNFEGKAGRFDKLIDIVVDAPLNRPVTIAEAAGIVGMSRISAEAMWAALCVRYGEVFSLGSDFREIRA